MLLVTGIQVAFYSTAGTQCVTDPNCNTPCGGLDGDPSNCCNSSIPSQICLNVVGTGTCSCLTGVNTLTYQGGTEWQTPTLPSCGGFSDLVWAFSCVGGTWSLQLWSGIPFVGTLLAEDNSADPLCSPFQADFVYPNTGPFGGFPTGSTFSVGGTISARVSSLEDCGPPS